MENMWVSIYLLYNSNKIELRMTLSQISFNSEAELCKYIRMFERIETMQVFFRA